MQINPRLLTNKVARRILCKNWIKTGPNHGVKAMFFPKTQIILPGNLETQYTIKSPKLALFTSKTCFLHFNKLQNHNQICLNNKN